MEKEELKQLILDKRKEGQVVVMGLEGPMSMSLEDIIRQPVDGLLYDLNRLEETALTFIDDPKWVNDFAVALVIRKLKSNLDELEAENKRLTALRELQAEIEPYALHLKPDVVMYKATPNLSSLADWVERFLTIMRSPRR